jgi:hypothetical protein
MSSLFSLIHETKGCPPKNGLKILFHCFDGKQQKVLDIKLKFI